MDTYFYTVEDLFTLIIKPDNDGFSLYFESEHEGVVKIGWYKTASMAADDVHMRATGFDEIDDFTGSLPEDLSYWRES